jgi:hypothetical protein
MSAVLNGVLLDAVDVARVVNLLSPAQPQWGVYSTGTSNPVIFPDSFYKVEFDDDSSASDYPVENGGFATYNKVMRPQGVHLVMLCGGQGVMSRPAFIATLKQMKASTEIYDIATPNDLITSVTLTRWNYRIAADDGVSLLTVEAIFEEVRQAPAATYSTSNASAGTPIVTSNSPDAASPVNTGSVQPSATITDLHPTVGPDGQPLG